VGARGGVPGARGASAGMGSAGSPRARGRARSVPRGLPGSAPGVHGARGATRAAEPPRASRAPPKPSPPSSAPAVAKCGKNAGRVSPVGSRRCARTTNGAHERGCASGHRGVRNATHHFAGVLVADGDVGVLHGDVLLDELALRLGLVGSLGGGLGDRRDDDGAARLDGLAPGAEASLRMTRRTGVGASDSGSKRARGGDSERVARPGKSSHRARHRRRRARRRTRAGDAARDAHLDGRGQSGHGGHGGHVTT
jgi:hypothetical protein